MKNPWKKWVYGIQNNHLDPMIDKFLMVWKTQYRSKRYLQICEMKPPKKM